MAKTKETEWDKERKWYQVSAQVVPELVVWWWIDADKKWEEWPTSIVAAITYELYETMTVASEWQHIVRRTGQCLDSRVIMSFWDPDNSVDWTPWMYGVETMQAPQSQEYTIIPRGMVPPPRD